MPASQSQQILLAMPRLTNQRYLMAYQWLHDLYLHDIEAFDRLTDEQLQLIRRFFDFTTQHSPRQLILHRRMVTAADRVLPHQAGKVLARLRRLEARHPTQSHQMAAVTPRGVRVRGIPRDKIDEDKMAMAIWMLAKDLAAERRRQAPRGSGHPDVATDADPPDP
jgi:hypothetical protein